MSKRIDLVTGFDGLNVVWIDDRVLLTQQEVDSIIAKTARLSGPLRVNRSDLVSINNVWANAVLTKTPEKLSEEISKSFAMAAIALQEVCSSHQCNLSLMDFRTARKECFEQEKNLFLIDLQNLTKPLGSTRSDVKWNWEIYGAHCVVHHNLDKSRYRFFSRLRTEKAQDVSRLLYHQFRDYSEVEQWCLRHDLTEPLKRNFAQFIRENLIHGDPRITEILLWSRDLPLGSDACENHASLSTGAALSSIRNRLSNKFDDESAKALFQGGAPWRVKPTPEYAINVSCLLSTLRSLELDIDCGTISKTQVIRFPCQPGLPFLLSLKAVVHEMSNDVDYYPPTRICLTCKDDSDRARVYTLTLFLNNLDKHGKPVNMEGFKKEFDTLSRNGRAKKWHFTTQRLRELKRCRLALRNPDVLGDKRLIVKGTSTNAVTVSLEKTPTRIEVKWKTKSP